jgi:hypothetical protein
MTLLQKFSAALLVVILVAFGLILALAEPRQAEAPAPAESGPATK